VRLAPPLIIGDAEVAEFTRKFAAALAAVSDALPTDPTGATA
jgi:acetylornithine/N-succinyldiaminopimelate aminotransferase